MKKTLASSTSGGISLLQVISVHISKWISGKWISEIGVFFKNNQNFYD